MSSDRAAEEAALAFGASLTRSDTLFNGGDEAGAVQTLLKLVATDPPPLVRAAAAHRLAALHASAGRFEDAETEFDRAIELVRAERGPDDPAIAALLDDLASTYGRAGRQDEAEAALLEAIDLLARARPADDVLHAQVLLRLGTLRMGSAGTRLTQAMLHFHEAYTLLSGLLGSSHALCATALERLAAGHLMNGEIESAEGFALRALRVLGADGPARGRASAHSTLAAVAASRRQNDLARAHAQQALAALDAEPDVAPEERQALEKNYSAFGIGERRS